MDGSIRTSERAVEGRLTGLIGLGETVTWRARHLGVVQQLQSQITDYQYPVLFEDCMLKGAFKSIRHVHTFERTEVGTLMRDHFCYQAPFGVLGKLAERIFLSRYMKRFLVERNDHIKDVAESEMWSKYLP